MKIKKRVMECIAAATMVASGANADVILNVVNDGGAWDGVATFLPAGAIWQLWMSNDNGAGQTLITLAGGNVDIDTVTGRSNGYLDPATQDRLVAQGVTADSGGGIFTPLPAADASNIGRADSFDALDSDVNNGFIYALMINLTGTAPAGTLTVGDWVNWGVVANLSAANDGNLSGIPPTPSTYDMTGGFASASGPLVIDGSFVVTPEPGTFALFALGLATIAWRRRKAKA